MSYVSSVQSYGSPLRPPLPQIGIEKPSTERADSQRERPLQTESAPERDAPSGRARLDPADLGARIGDLVAEQVSSGALSSEQGDAVRSVFAGPPRGNADPSLRDGDGALSGTQGRIPARPEDAPRGRDTTETGRDVAVRQFVDQLRQSLASGYSAGGAATRASRPLAFDLSA